MMLGSLDNEVIFKKAFTDKIVFTQFVKDIIGIDIEVDVIETEKKFEPKVGYIDFELDIFAESVDKRVVIEIQRVEYDHNFDRFLHYFMMTISEQQKKAREYKVDRTVYVIVVLTAKFKVDEETNLPLREEVLITKLSTKNIIGKEIGIYKHQLVCLNPNYPDNDTPQNIRDWLDLIYQSIHNSERAVLNRNNVGIMRAVELIEFDNMSPEERRDSKNEEARKSTKALNETWARREERRKNIKALIANGATFDLIATAFNITHELIQIYLDTPEDEPRPTPNHD